MRGSRDLAFELPLPKRWISDLKNRLLRNYRGPVSLKDPSHAHSKPVITYLSRQTAAHRHLRDHVHDALITGLKRLEEEGIAEVHIEEFTDADPKDEQIAKLSRTTVSAKDTTGWNPLLTLLLLTIDLRLASRKWAHEFDLDDAGCTWSFDSIRDPTEGHVFRRLCSPHRSIGNGTLDHWWPIGRQHGVSRNLEGWLAKVSQRSDCCSVSAIASDVHAEYEACLPMSK